MTISKTHNNMLFMLASLACGQSDSKSVTSMGKQRTLCIAAISDVSDDETSTSTTASPAKELVVARRRRRPLKKRRPSSDFSSSSSPLLFLGASIKPRKSLLEASIDIVGNSSLKKAKPSLPSHVEAQDEKLIVPEAQDRNDDEESQEAQNEMPSLVPDDAAWKDVHSPLHLPNFLPCPAMALKDVKSINLIIQER